MWVGYFDEGAVTGAEPACHGLVRFGQDLSAEWLFPQNSGYGHIWDCYALNCIGEIATAYSYDDFDILQVEHNHIRRWTGSPSGAAEEATGIPVSIAVAHHSFLNPLVLSRINRRRQANGRPRFRLVCFVHGTALKMFAHEQAGVDPAYPRRFLPIMERAGVFDADGEIDLCAAISAEQLDKFNDVFAGYPRDRMLLSPNGYAGDVFHADADGGVDRRSVLADLTLATPPTGPIDAAPTAVDPDVDRMIVFTGKFADWKRLDALLSAAARYERNEGLGKVATVIIGSGPDHAIEAQHRLAYDDLGLEHTYFLGPLPQPDIARLNAVADLGVYPSRNEPFGLVFIECMACGTPVVGANSGGPKDFVSEAVGGLVPETEGDELIDALVETIERALTEDWKSSKGPAAAEFAAANFSTARQCEALVEAAERTPR